MLQRLLTKYAKYIPKNATGSLDTKQMFKHEGLELILSHEQPELAHSLY